MHNTQGSAIASDTREPLCECDHPESVHNAGKKCQASIMGTGAASAFVYPCPCKRFKAQV